MPIKISIIVPAFNEEKLIAQSLEAMKAAAGAFTERGWEWELVVCDNNSKDRTTEIAQAAGARVVFEPKNQISRARNTGASIAQGEWFLFVDADSHPSKELLSDLADTIAAGRALGGGAAVKLDQDIGRVGMIAEFWNKLSRWQKWAAGSFVYCEASAFRELGGFSLELFASEEIEFSQRLKKLAKARGREVIILKKHPLITSARKAHLYTKGEHVRFMLRTIFSRGKTLKQAETAAIWYDGRR